MKKKREVGGEWDELRKRAEEQLKKNNITSDFLYSKKEWQRVVQELSIHQIELEMQKEALQDSMDEIQRDRQRYSALYDFAPVGYLTLAQDSTILEANLAIARMLSVERSRLKGARFGSFIALRDLPAFNSMFKKVFQCRTRHFCEIVIGNIDFHLDAIISDNLQECLLTLTDISDTRRAIEALKNKEAQYRRLFEAAQEGILILDYKSGKFIDANPFIFTLLGFAPTEIIGKDFLELGIIIDKEHAQKTHQELQSKNYLHYPDIPLKHKSGKIIDVEFLGYVYEVGHEKTIQCNIRDISDQKKMREYEKTISTSHQETIHALASMVEIRDSYTAGHQKRVAELSVAIAEELQLSAGKIEGLQLSSILHDIGKFNIPKEILLKSTPLTEAEMEILRNHSQAGYDVLKGIHFPWPIAQTVLQHHERLDGSGYPNQLKGDSISKEAKIIGVADTVEAMTGTRPYRPALGIEKALQHIQSESGKLFDPVIVDKRSRRNDSVV